MRPAPIAHWHRLIETKDLSGIDQLLAPDAVFHSPALHTPQVGRELVAKYLRAAGAVLNNATFTYTGEWVGEQSAVLEFEVTIDGIYVNGVDLIHWNSDGQIDRFKVMVRPLKALNALVAAMGRQLEKTA
jgi:ketosteroid isomerase-like protein